MKKKIALLLALISAFLLVSCQAAGEVSKEPEGASELKEMAAGIISTYYLLDNPGDQAMYVDMYLQQIQEAYPAIYEGYFSWQTLMKEVGGVDALAPEDTSYIKESQASENGEKVSVDVLVQGREREGNVVFVFDKATGNPLSISMNARYSFGEQMGKAGMNTLIGMGIVFVVLILISLIISLFGVARRLQKAKEAPEEPSLAEKSMGNIVAQIAEREEEELVDDNELIAVITAAVAAFEAGRSPKHQASAGDFVVRSVRRVRRS